MIWFIQVTNTFRCEELKYCALCKIHNTGEYVAKECEETCNYTIMGTSKLADDVITKKCETSDVHKCIINFEYFYENKMLVVKVLKQKTCPQPVNILGKKLSHGSFYFSIYFFWFQGGSLGLL